MRAMPRSGCSSASLPQCTTFFVSLWAFAATLLLGATAAYAQSVDEPGRCFRAQRQPVCDRYRVFEVGIFEPFKSSRFTRSDDRAGEMPVGERLPVFDTYVSGGIGFMMNYRATAQGAVATLGMARSGPRFGAQLRQRVWFGRTGSIDLSLGVVNAMIDGPGGRLAGFGGTGDIAVGWGDYAHLVVHADRLKTDDGTVGMVSSGIRLGSYPAVIATALGTVTLIILAGAIYTGAG